MGPPRGLDDQGRELPTRRCPTCGAPWPLQAPTHQFTGWGMYAATNWDGTPGMVLVPEWCGHPREYLPGEVDANRYLLVEILGEAR